jgi:hypothetical protein
MGVGAAGALAGDQSGLGGWAGAVGSIVAPRVAAKLITNTAFVRWMAEPVKQGTQEWAAHFAKLVAIGEVNPEIKEAIGELVSVMHKNTAPEKSNEKKK